jgi:hypothetical protein
MDDTDPAACARVREYLLEGCYSDPHILALWRLSKDHTIKGSSSEESEAAWKHIQSCSKCDAWLHEIVPGEILNRQSRLVRYCCSAMFVAVEESDKYQRNRFTYSLFRGEDVCWRIDGKQSFAMFCPWCGHKLPDRPFIE